MTRVTWFLRDSKRRGMRLAIMALGAIVLSGCSDQDTKAIGTKHDIQGKVLLPDGKPLTNVKVVFSGPAMTSGVTDAGGAFALKDANGLPTGDYQVRLEVVETKGSAKRPVAQFPPWYADEDSSGLTAKVTDEGPNDFEFKLSNENPTPKAASKAERR